MRAHETPATTWASEVESGLETILGLREGWDGYDAQPVDDDIAVFALDLLDRVLPDGAPAPSIVPTPNGGIQFEWHERNWELEIEVSGRNQIAVLGDSRPSGRLSPINSERLGDVAGLAKWIAQALAS